MRVSEQGGDEEKKGAGGGREDSRRGVGERDVGEGDVGEGGVGEGDVGEGDGGKSVAREAEAWARRRTGEGLVPAAARQPGASQAVAVSLKDPSRASTSRGPAPFQLSESLQLGARATDLHLGSDWRAILS
eukprot:763053-Hanusia_phi.AAC.7